MLEGLATWVLNTYLGQYFENLNADQLSIGLLRGELELENVPLRKDALQNFDIPLRVVSGFVGKVKLQIPVSRLRSEPWVINFEHFYCTISPIKISEYDEDRASKVREDRKFNQLDMLEAAWRNEQGIRASDRYATTASTWFSYGTSIFTNIIENIQLHINDVHLRYEDEQSCAGCVFACGLTVRSLSVRSTNSSWTCVYVQDRSSPNGAEAKSYKLVELVDLSLYWDTKSNICSSQSLPKLSIELDESCGGQHQYLLKPVSATACLTRNLSTEPLKSRATPRISCHISMPLFPLQLTNLQFKQMVEANRLYDRLDRARQYKKHRPIVSVMENPSEWWKFAIQCHLDEVQMNRKNANWEFIVDRSLDLVEYVDAYMRHLNYPGSMSIDDRDIMTRVESELGFTELKALREISMRRVEMQTPKHRSLAHGASTTVSPSSTMAFNSTDSIKSGFIQPIKSMSTTTLVEAANPPARSGETLLQRWFPSWGGWYSATENQTDNAGFDEEVQRLSASTSSSVLDDSVYDTPEISRQNSFPSLESSAAHDDSFSLQSDGLKCDKMDERKLLSASVEEELLYVLSDSIENNTFTKRDAVFCQLSFTLKEGQFTLLSHSSYSQKIELFQLEFSNVMVGLESRPRNKSHKFDIELGALKLRDKVTASAAFPYLVAPQLEEDNSNYGLHYKLSKTPSIVPGFSQRLTGLYQRPSSSCADSSANLKPLFVLSYEYCPMVHSQADHKLSVVSQPLDLVYNKDSIEAATNFFTQGLKSVSKYKDVHLPLPSSALSLSARRQYNSIMEQTKEQLRKNFDDMWHGKIRKKWLLDLNISAPQILIPSHLQDSNATLIVVDLGHLTFRSADQLLNCDENAKHDANRCRITKSASSSSWGGLITKVFGGQEADDADDSEQFATPCSTPEDLRCASPSTIQEPNSETLTEELLQSQIYDKYEMYLSDMQVLVCKVRENWRFAFVRGTSTMHVVDRFNINVLLSRRLVATAPSDRPWPTATLMATLPSVMFHLSETKVRALVTLSKILTFKSVPTENNTPVSNVANRYNHPADANETENSLPNGTFPRSDTNTSMVSLIQNVHLDESQENLTPFARASKKIRSVAVQESKSREYLESATVDDSKLLVVQVNVEKVSIELASRGRSIAEVQVTGVKGTTQHWLHNFSFSLNIHSFLLVDALQTFGPDFDLLIASHKRISMDSMSGSLLNSEPCSPTSPASPDHNVANSLRPTSPVTLTRALHVLVSSPSLHKSCQTNNFANIPSPVGISSPGEYFHQGEIDSEALISLEITYVSPSCPSHKGSAPLLIGSLQFNSLDVIANQETIVELVGFCHQLVSIFTNEYKPESNSSCCDSGLHNKTVDVAKTEATKMSKNDGDSLYGSLAKLSLSTNKEYPFSEVETDVSRAEPLRIEMNFDFVKLGVLLLRATVKCNELVGRKVATAVLSNAKIKTTISNHQLNVEGSLGGFQVRDVTPEKSKHKCIVSVGQDFQADLHQDLLSKLTTGIYQSYAEREAKSLMKAFSFSIQRPLILGSFTSMDLWTCKSKDDDSEKLNVSVQLASVLYTHSPSFLNELTSCADEFKTYMAQLAQGIKNAATEMAIGLVSKRIESFASLPGYTTNKGGQDSPLQRVPSLARSIDTLHLPQPPPATASQVSPTHACSTDITFKLRLSAVLETPIIVLPESSGSTRALVAQLGQITVENVLDQKDQACTGECDSVNENNVELPATTPDLDCSLYEEFDNIVKVVKYNISIRQINLYSVNVEDTDPKSEIYKPSIDFYRSASSEAILHNTDIELCLVQKRCPPLLLDSHAGMYCDQFHTYNAKELSSSPGTSGSISDTFEVVGGVVTPVKLTLSRQQYRQISQTFSNVSLTFKKPSDHAAVLKSHSLDNILEEGIANSIYGSKQPGAESNCLKSTPSTTQTRIDSSQKSITSDTRVAINGLFTVPVLKFVLTGDVNTPNQPFVNLILEDFSAFYQKSKPFETTMKVTLKSLVMEDLLCAEGSAHRYLLRSIKSPEECTTLKDTSMGSSFWALRPPFISSSCPDLRKLLFRKSLLSRSLPSKLELEKPFFKAHHRVALQGSARKRRSRFKRSRQGSSLCEVLTLPSVEMSVTDNATSAEKPFTPPPSPISTNDFSAMQSLEDSLDLVKITILNIDSNNPEYMSKYDGNDRFIDVAFNSLVLTVNISSWVMILDFFSSENDINLLGSAGEVNLDGTVHGECHKHVQNSSAFHEGLSEDHEKNTILEFSVACLELVLIRADEDNVSGSEIAGASVSNVYVRSVGSDGNTTLSGRLGSLVVTDMTPFSCNYEHKFLTSDSEALTFQLFQYGLSDPDMLRECDVRLSIKMSSVMYIHTQRFATELLYIGQQFNQLQAVVQRWHALRAGHSVQENARGARVSISVSAGSPVIFLPLASSGSDLVLVVDLGSLNINNKFMWAGTNGTISKIDREDLHERLSGYRNVSRSRSQPTRSRSRSRSGLSTAIDSVAISKPPKCLLDVIDVNLTNMDLYSARFVRRQNVKNKRKNVTKQKSSMESSDSEKTNESARKNVKVVWKFPHFDVVSEGKPILNEKCALLLQVERNLDAHVSKRVPNISVEGGLSKISATVTECTYKLIRGLLQYNLGEDLSDLQQLQDRFHHPHIPLTLSQSLNWNEDIYITLSISIDLDNVVVEFIQNANSCQSLGNESCNPLVSFNLIKSRLVYQSNSECGKDIDLVSQEILIYDIRYRDLQKEKRPNIFHRILQPTPEDTVKNEGLLQAELHYRSTKEVTRFTILVNNMRLMAIIDWWLDVLTFVQLQATNPNSEKKTCVIEKQGNHKAFVHSNSSNNITPFINLFSPLPSRPATPQSEIATSSGAFSRNLSRKSSGLGRASPRLHPLVESTGVMTKHLLIEDLSTSFNDTCVLKPSAFELKINITDSEIVIVENTAMVHSNALILKNTTVFSYRPCLLERPLSCNVTQCEIYSCVLTAEKDTALSILDPVSVNFEVIDRGIQHEPSFACGVIRDVNHVIEITLHQVNLRLSYHDLKLFNSILQNLSHLKNDKMKTTSFKTKLEQLKDLGFSESDCNSALRECFDSVDDAALWLTKYARPVEAITGNGGSQSDTSPTAIKICAVEMKTSCVHLCLIDDCGDCDVPLLEFSLLQFCLRQDLSWLGSASFKLAVNYYNRCLSGWEPFFEPWRCTVEWERKPLANYISGDTKSPRGDKLCIHVKAQEIMNVNITSSLMELYQNVKRSWTSDYNLGCRSADRQGSDNYTYRHRTPFIPFTLLNDTGCNLSFATFAAFTHGERASEFPSQEIVWKKVAPGESVPFSFDSQGPSKVRHGDTHNHKMHQIGVHVEGWQPVGPFTVDRVGTFFRSALPMDSSAESRIVLSSARVVVRVSLAGIARKLVTIRSALLLRNELPITVEAKLDNLANRGGDVKLLQIKSQTTVSIPLHYVWAGIKIKPLESLNLHKPLCGSDGSPSFISQEESCSERGWLFHREPIHWRTLTKCNEVLSELKCCPSLNSSCAPYRFCVHIRREGYPLDKLKRIPKPSTSPLLPVEESSHPLTLTSYEEWIQPAHAIFVVSPVTLVNLLPCDLHFKVTSSGLPNNNVTTGINATLPQNIGFMKPGEKRYIHSVDPEEGIRLQLWSDSLTMSGDYVFINSFSNSTIPIELQDNSGRVVQLQLRVAKHYGKALKLSVFASYWLINKTGLPLVFRQDGCSSDAAGQDGDHEAGRCAVPLLFSLVERESGMYLTSRVGQRLHPSARPNYCHKLSLNVGSYVRRLYVTFNDNRPDIVYIVGIDVRIGKGPYRDTFMVTFSPRFQIENKSSQELRLGQTWSTDVCAVGGEKTWLRLMPGSFLAFHWPRLDKDQLLSLKILPKEGRSGYWSGGITIESSDSFHINVRDADGNSQFLRIETLMREATYFTVISDSKNFPPPFRIDNFSEVPVTYFQTGTQFPHLRSVVRSHCSVPYAWDEPTLSPYLTCVAPGGVSATYNLNELREGARLTYENFIYIAFTGSFRNTTEGDDESIPMDPCAVENQHLVLDVIEGTKVQLARKQLGKRSQLWRMTSTGKLQHEGSSPPSDPTQPRKDDGNTLVLDINGTAPQPRAYTPLVLRRPDPRRQLTQTWQFTEDGRLCCKHHNLFVQASDGFLGLSTGKPVVLGPPRPRSLSGVPLEQAVSRQRLRPGSGMLSLTVVADGPTRALQITDFYALHQPVVARGEGGELIMPWGTSGDPRLNIDKDTRKENDAATSISCSKTNHQGQLVELQVLVTALGGVGVSVVQQTPTQELVYMRLMGVVLEYCSSQAHRTLDASVRDIQVDNQLSESSSSVLVFVTPQSRADDSRHLPALTLSVYHQRHNSLYNNVLVFKNLRVCLKNLSITLEEEVVCRLLLLADSYYNRSSSQLGQDDWNIFSEGLDPLQESRISIQAATSAESMRYYFGLLELQLHQVRLSVLTCKQISADLLAVRRRSGLDSLVRFENALVHLKPFVRNHLFETAQFLWESLVKHYTVELSKQALRILGSTDFLGNPSGLLADVSEGMNELVHEGSLQGFMWNVTHGLSNSAAKVSGSLSDGLGRVTMDDAHEALRRRLAVRTETGVTRGSDQFMNGMKGLGLGLYGGLTSIVAQTYTGVQQEGVPGLFSGLAKGVLGTVTKPAVGMLDLFSSAAYALRDSSKTPQSRGVQRQRPVRVVVGLSGLLPRYCLSLAMGQQLLRATPQSSASEIVVAYEPLREGHDEMRVLVTSERVWVFSQTEQSTLHNLMLSATYHEILDCRSVVLNYPHAPECPDDVSQKFYFELTITSDSSSDLKKPKVRCDSLEIADKVTHEINCARNLHAELWQTVAEVDQEEDD